MASISRAGRFYVISIASLTRTVDDADMYHGAPACVQIVGQRLQEEKLLVIAQRVVDAIEEYKYKQERLSGKETGLKVQNTDING